MTFSDIFVQGVAKVCHEANRAYCEALGDHSQPAWHDAPIWQRESAISGVRYLLGNPAAAPRDSHNRWLADKRAAGWTWGPVKDAAAKLHPCFVPYSELPVEQRAKDHIFHAIVNAMR